MQAQEEGAPDTKDVVGATPAAAKDVAKTLASALREMAQEIEENPQTTCTASQAMGLAFMKNRLPPHPDQLPPSGKEPTLHSLVCCRKEVRTCMPTTETHLAQPSQPFIRALNPLHTYTWHRSVH